MSPPETETAPRPGALYTAHEPVLVDAVTCLQWLVMHVVVGIHRAAVDFVYWPCQNRRRGYSSITHLSPTGTNCEASCFVRSSFTSATNVPIYTQPETLSTRAVRKLQGHSVVSASGYNERTH